MIFLSIILLWTTLYFAWEAKAWEGEADDWKAIADDATDMLHHAGTVLDKAMGATVNLARAHTIICDLYDEDVEDGIREMCGREYDKYVDDDWM